METIDKYQIFKQGSRTYYYSSIFFPKKVKDDVFDLYAFVRVIDDFVDIQPQQPKKFEQFKHDYFQAINGNPTNNQIVDNFVALANKKHFEPQWTESFFQSMAWDLEGKKYQTINDTIKYMYGSAEIIGLMMARTLDLPLKADHAARMLGRSMQYVNFIRDIEEDIQLDRNYFPQTEMESHNLESLDFKYIQNHLDSYYHFIRHQIKRYREWQKEAEAGFKYLPRRYRIPIATASQMYKWTADIIDQDPLIVYCHKIKPSKPQILKQVFMETFKMN